MIQRYEPYEKKYECISGPPLWMSELRPALNGRAVLWEDYKQLDELTTELTGTLNFILAFYDPDANKYLDTNAWKNAEASGRYVLGKAKNRPGTGQGGL